MIKYKTVTQTFINTIRLFYTSCVLCLFVIIALNDLFSLPNEVRRLIVFAQFLIRYFISKRRHYCSRLFFFSPVIFFFLSYTTFFKIKYLKNGSIDFHKNPLTGNS